MHDTEKYTNEELKFWKEEILGGILNVFDLIQNTDKLEDFISFLNEEERDELYSHPLLKEYDLLP